MQNKKGVTGSGVDEGKKYISFVRGNMDQIDKKITDDLWALSAIEVRNISNRAIVQMIFQIIEK